MSYEVRSTLIRIGVRLISSRPLRLSASRSKLLNITPSATPADRAHQLVVLAERLMLTPDLKHSMSLTLMSTESLVHIIPTCHARSSRPKVVINRSGTSTHRLSTPCVPARTHIDRKGTCADTCLSSRSLLSTFFDLFVRGKFASAQRPWNATPGWQTVRQMVAARTIAPSSTKNTVSFCEILLLNPSTSSATRKAVRMRMHNVAVARAMARKVSQISNCGD